MNTQRTLNAMIGWTLCMAILCPGGALAEASGEDRPHVLVILADDLGWNDVGYHGSEIRTPTLDRLAADGVELDRFYVQPTCSPTRSGLMTGKSPMRLGLIQPLGKNDKTGLPLSEKILPQYLAELGYQPWMVGKWHLGNHTVEQFPQARGFEHFYGFLSGGIGYWDHNHGGGHDWQRNGVTLRESGYTTHLITDEAIRLVRDRDRLRPTFLYVAYNAPHLPNEAPEEAVARYANIEDPDRRVHAAMVDEMDRSIAHLLAVYEQEGMLENTIILFSSDNGGLVRDGTPASILALSDLALRWFDRPMPFAGLEFVVANVEDAGSDNSPLPEGKGSVAEGGARVPASISWPGRLEAGVHGGMVTISDVLPTLLDAIGAADSIPTDLDGSSQWAALTGAGASETRDYVTNSMGRIAIYRSPWKLFMEDPPRLYNVVVDPLEQEDLTAQQPAIVASLRARAEAWPAREWDATTAIGLLWDPDSFGGPEDREPWADVARERLKNVR